MISQLGLDHGAENFGQEEGQDVDDAVHDLLSHSEQIAEVNCAVLLSQGVSYLGDKFLWETD